MSRTLQVFFNIKSQANSTLRVFFFSNWSMVDLQRCVGFKCTKNDSVLDRYSL